MLHLLRMSASRPSVVPSVSVRTDACPSSHLPPASCPTVRCARQGVHESDAHMHDSAHRSALRSRGITRAAPIAPRPQSANLHLVVDCTPLSRLVLGSGTCCDRRGYSTSHKSPACYDRTRLPVQTTATLYNRDNIGRLVFIRCLPTIDAKIDPATQGRNK